jgi:hypothetical protein
MADLQVTSVKRAPGRPARVSLLAGQGWRWTAREVTGAIAHQVHTFYVLVDGLRHEVGIVQDGEGRHLRTFRDGQWNDYLARLPACPRPLRARRQVSPDEEMLRAAFSRIQQDVARLEEAPAPARGRG